MYKNFLVLMLCLGAFTLCGCTLFSGKSTVDDTPAVASEGGVQSSPAEKVSTQNPKDTVGKGSKGATNVATKGSVQQKLDATAQKLVSTAAKTVTPSIKNKAVNKVGNQYVASYTIVDESSTTTEVRPGSSAGTYIGVIRYVEHHYECRGKTKAEALQAQCDKTRTRRMSELIRYDGKKWAY